jgi:hypothetical protein
MINSGKEWSWMERYPHGYLPKIKYWAEELVSASTNGETHRIPRIMRELEYFTTRQKEIGV